MLNQIVLTGNLGGDPEVFFSSNGEPIAKFSIAFTFGNKKTGWIKCSCFNKLAEVAEKYLHKGARIALIGVLCQEKWESGNGEPKNNYQLIVNTIEFIKTDGRGFEENAQSNNNQSL